MLAEIRGDEELKDIPVVVLTGSHVRRAILQAEALHVDGFMTKPVDLEKFIGAVSRFAGLGWPSLFCPP